MSWLSDLLKYGFTAEQRAASRASERYVQTLEAYERELASLTQAEAQAAAERVLAGSRFVRATPRHDVPARHTELAPTLREFFERFSRLEVAKGGAHADIAELRPLDWAPGYLSLGATGVEHTHLAIRPRDESIYILADDVPIHQRTESTFPTIYHWILWLERTEELLAKPDPPTA